MCKLVQIIFSDILSHVNYITSVVQVLGVLLLCVLAMLTRIPDLFHLLWQITMQPVKKDYFLQSHPSTSVSLPRCFSRSSKALSMPAWPSRAVLPFSQCWLCGSVMNSSQCPSTWTHKTYLFKKKKLFHPLGINKNAVLAFFSTALDNLVPC